MSATSSNMTPLIRDDEGFYNNKTDLTRIQSLNHISYIQYRKPTHVRYSYSKPSKPKYRYTIQQDGQTYRCCQWCQQWCTRKWPIFDFCDRIVSCPLLFFILSALLLLLLFAALVTLFSLHPNINSSRRFYGIISTTSIVNRTIYIFGLDGLCNRIGITANCLDLSTSTSISLVTTTITMNQTNTTTTFSMFLLLISQLFLHMRQQ